MKYLQRQSASVHDSHDRNVTALTLSEINTTHKDNIAHLSKENDHRWCYRNTGRIRCATLSESSTSGNSSIDEVSPTACNKNAIMIRTSGIRRSERQLLSLPSRKILLLSRPTLPVESSRSPTASPPQFNFWSSLILRNSNNTTTKIEKSEYTFENLVTTSPSPLSVSCPTSPASTNSFSLSIHINKQQIEYRRSVSFDETQNVLIDSEISSLKEYRKKIWWSHKDRIRALKQRERDIQQILMNNPYRHLMNDVSYETDHVNSISVNAAQARDNVEYTPVLVDSGQTPLSKPPPFKYCEAIATLYNYCCNQCTEKVTCVEGTDRDKLNAHVHDAIQLLVQSNYRGLERIVCKILHYQQHQLKTTKQQRNQHFLLPTKSKTYLHAPELELLHKQSKSNDPDLIHDVEGNLEHAVPEILNSHNIVTMVSRDDDIAVEVSLLPSSVPPNNTKSLSTQVQSVQQLPSTVSVAGSVEPPSSSAMHIRKSFLDYQGKLRQANKQNSGNSKSDNLQRNGHSLVVNTSTGDDDIHEILSSYYVSTFCTLRQTSIMWSQLIASTISENSYS